MSQVAIRQYSYGEFYSTVCCHLGPVTAFTYSFNCRSFGVCSGISSAAEIF